MTIGDPSKDLVPLALVGRVPCKVTNINGPIRRGDLLTTSPIPGYAMRATKAGPVIGKALEEFNAKRGKILVFANTGWYSGEEEHLSNEETKNFNKISSKISFWARIKNFLIK